MATKRIGGQQGQGRDGAKARRTFWGGDILVATVTVPGLCCPVLLEVRGWALVLGFCPLARHLGAESLALW